ncbi:Copia protein [Porphyridium purpureum]|uniref:Copia protein n=1 Tax=Porphyridium purpureum TaxID=35688 RepID=A0A5J4YQ56_PORPP|nr:Copia protein [Porphyridium purpureum]|eukprot:POR8332..scf296_7
MNNALTAGYEAYAASWTQISEKGGVLLEGISSKDLRSHAVVIGLLGPQATRLNEHQRGKVINLRAAHGAERDGCYITNSAGRRALSEIPLFDRTPGFPSIRTAISLALHAHGEAADALLFDIGAAYVYASLRGNPAFARLKSLVPFLDGVVARQDLRKIEGLRDPVVPLLIVLYGLPRLGFDYSAHAHGKLCAAHWKESALDKIVSWRTRADVHTQLVIYIDDGAILGTTESVREAMREVVQSGVANKSPPEVLTYLGKLMWLVKTNRPDLAHAVAMIARYADCWSTDFERAISDMLAYVCDAKHADASLRYSVPQVRSCDVNIVCYVDSDLDLGRSMSGTIPFLSSGDTRHLIEWSSRRQRRFATSTAESKLVALHSTKHSALFPAARFIENVHRRWPRATVCYDNEAALGAVAGAFSPALIRATKTQKTRLSWLHEPRCKELVAFDLVPTRVNVADPLTKALSADVFRDHARAWGFSLPVLSRCANESRSVGRTEPPRVPIQHLSGCDQKHLF